MKNNEYQNSQIYICELLLIHLLKTGKQHKRVMKLKYSKLKHLQNKTQ